MEFLGITGGGKNGEFDIKDFASFDMTDMEKDSETRIVQDGQSPESAIPKGEVVNMMATVNFQVKFDLNKIVQSSRNAEYNEKRFKAVILRIQEPKATALIFENGTTNILGIRTEENALRAAKKFGKILKNIGFKVKLRNFKIVNLVSRVDFGFPIEIGRLASAEGHSRMCKYEPQEFAGAIYKVAKPKTTLLIFRSGKVMIMGAKKLEEIDEAILYIFPILRQFRKKSIDEIRQEIEKKKELDVEFPE